jgi:glycosyltransferase involved in cell wall biosynthesis
VYRSQAVVGRTVAELLDFLASEPSLEGRPYEVILVDDGSPDDSWSVIAGIADKVAEVKALRLLRNYGQHCANLAGFAESRGTWVVTMDDDGQNPPTAIPALLEKAAEGHDVVFGRLARKEASSTRKIGSRIVSAINRRVFHQPADLAVSNVRLLHRTVVERILEDRTPFPYITGQAILHSADPADVEIDHRARLAGESGYGAGKIARLVLDILFSYSVWPLRAMALLGAVIALLSMIAAGIYVVRGLTGATQVEGWATLAVLVSLLGGITIGLLSMLGEYVVRIMLRVRDLPRYVVATRVPDE